MSAGTSANEFREASIKIQLPTAVTTACETVRDRPRDPVGVSPNRHVHWTLDPNPTGPSTPTRPLRPDPSHVSVYVVLARSQGVLVGEQGTTDRTDDRGREVGVEEMVGPSDENQEGPVLEGPQEVPPARRVMG